MAKNYPSGTEAARRVLDVLVSFSASRPEWSATELSASLGQSRAMTYRYLALLREFDLVEPCPNSRYRLSNRLIGLASAANLGGARLIECARPFMNALSTATSETVLLTVRVGWRMYCIERVDSPQPVRLQLDRGRPMPLHSGSLARVLLAALAPKERSAYFAEHGLENRSALLSDEALDEVVRQGHAESRGEIDGAIWGYSVPVIQEGNVVAAVGVTAPYARNSEAALAEIRRRVTEAGLQISADLEHRERHALNPEVR